MNPNHDERGRFASGSGGGGSLSNARVTRGEPKEIPAARHITQGQFDAELKNHPDLARQAEHFSQSGKGYYKRYLERTYPAAYKRVVSGVLGSPKPANTPLARHNAAFDKRYGVDPPGLSAKQQQQSAHARMQKVDADIKSGAWKPFAPENAGHGGHDHEIQQYTQRGVHRGVVIGRKYREEED